MQKKILILGASILQLPAIRRAKELGYIVAVADFNSHAIGIAHADHYYNVSTNDVPGICKVAKEFEPNGILTLATDMPIRSIAVANSILGLTGISIDTAIKSTDKGEMIKAFKANNVASPWFCIINSIDQVNQDNITYPCIIKPIDNSGSRGVCFVENRQQLNKAFQYSRNESRGGVVIIEEYLTGQEVSVEVMVVDDEPHIMAVTDKLTNGNPHFVEIGHSQQSQLPINKVSEIKELAVKAVKAIGIKNSPAHVEIMSTSNGPKMIELGARMGGDCISTHLVPLSTGIDMIKATIDLSLGIQPDIIQKFDKGSAIKYLELPYGKIQSITGIEDALGIRGVKEISLIKQVGEYSTEIRSSVDRIGYVVAQSENAKEAIEICNRAIDKIQYEIV